MIKNHAMLLLVLLAVVSSLHFLARTETTKKIFQFLPPPFWCYFFPTILSTMGWIPNDSPVYSTLSRFLLPGCLILLLLGVSPAPLLQLGARILGTMFAASSAICFGGLVTFILLLFSKITTKAKYGDELWKGWGCLTASWTGGSANMVSVKEILQIPETIFSNLIIVDVVVAYSWLAFLMLVSRMQRKMNGLLGAVEAKNDLTTFTLLSSTSSDFPFAPLTPHSSGGLQQRGRDQGVRFVVAMLALICGQGLWYISQYLPFWGAILNRMSWTVIFATLFPILLSILLEKKLKKLNTDEIGTFLLYFLLACMGAKANLASLFSAPLFMALGFLWVAIHSLILCAFGKFFHIPISLLATASQANIGGPVSAPIVAAVYDKQLVPAAVVLAILGGIYGTAVGLVVAEICRKIMSLV